MNVVKTISFNVKTPPVDSLASCSIKDRKLFYQRPQVVLSKIVISLVIGRPIYIVQKSPTVYSTPSMPIYESHLTQSGIPLFSYGVTRLSMKLSHHSNIILVFRSYLTKNKPSLLPSTSRMSDETLLI